MLCVIFLLRGSVRGEPASCKIKSSAALWSKGSCVESGQVYLAAFLPAPIMMYTMELTASR